MTRMLPHALCPPDPARALRTGRCELGLVLYMCPIASAGLPPGLLRAWLDDLRAAVRTGAQLTPVRLTLPDGASVDGWALSARRPSSVGYDVGSRWPRFDEPVALDGLPAVRTREAPPPAPRGARWYAPDEDEDENNDSCDIFEDYAELAGMSRDEWMLSVD